MRNFLFAVFISVKLIVKPNYDSLSHVCVCLNKNKLKDCPLASGVVPVAFSLLGIRISLGSMVLEDQRLRRLWLEATQNFAVFCVSGASTCTQNLRFYIAISALWWTIMIS